MVSGPLAIAGDSSRSFVALAEVGRAVGRSRSEAAPAQQADHGDECCDGKTRQLLHGLLLLRFSKAGAPLSGCLNLSPWGKVDIEAKVPPALIF
jgi:hypothetical protein